MVATRRRIMPMIWRAKMAARRISMVTLLETEERKAQEETCYTTFHPLLCMLIITSG